jgi:hypothetical protein
VAATVALLGVAAGPARATDADTSTLYYAEPGRVTAWETRGEFRTDLPNDQVLRLHVTFDALTGASPIGVPASRLSQTFTRYQTLTGASGGGSTTTSSNLVVGPGQTPIDPTFRDKRFEGGGEIEWPIGDLAKGTVGATASFEHDYISFGAHANFARDLFQKNTTLALGLSGSLDDVRPVGGAPVALSEMPTSPPPSSGEGEDGGGGTPGKTKRVGDVLVGFTQVLNRSTLMQLNYSLSGSTGYETDPYKLVALIQGPTAALPGDPVAYLYESRPDHRLKQAVYGEAKHAFGRHVMDLSYRYLWDDWGIRSKTWDGRWSLELNDRNSFEPQVRFYHQTAADFYVHGLVDERSSGTPLPAYVTSDNRLGEFDAWTGALKYSYRLSAGPVLGIRLGYYVQTGNSHPADAIGSQQTVDLFPKVTAVISQVSYSFQF